MTKSNATVIDVQNLTKFYGLNKAISDISFSMQKGEILGFLGPNGAGKTTTIRILAGFIPASFGTATIGGYDVFEESLKARSIIGYVPENPPLYPEMTIISYLNFHARLKGVPKKERRGNLDRVLQLFHLGDVRNKIIGKLSKGYRQRVGLAQALIHNPQVLLLDEPTSGLDPKQIIDTREVIRSLAGEHTILLSTHILPEVSMTCNRVVIINEGRVIAEDSPEKLTGQLERSRAVYCEISHAGDGLAESLRALDEVSSVTIQPEEQDSLLRLTIESGLDQDIRPQIARTVVESGAFLHELRAVRLSLEDIYLKLITEEEGVSA